MRIDATTEIARPLEEVWAFVSDLRNDARWCADVISVEQISGDGPGPGAKYDVVHRPVKLRGPKPLAEEITEFEPPRRMRIREEDGDAVFVVAYELAEVPGGTELTQVDEIDWKIPFPGPQIGRLMVARGMKRQLAALKRLLEAG